MAYKISDDCISCGACEPECPNKAIKEGSSIYEINTDLCTECVGSFAKQQCAEICPVGAPIPDKARIETHGDLLTRWEKIHPGENPKVT